MGFIYYRVVNLSQRLKISGEFLLGFDDDPLPEAVYCIFERMVVVDDNGICCGIVSQADIALCGIRDETAEVVEKISEPVR